MFNVSDERVVEAWVENPYWQAFCGYDFLQWKFPAETHEAVGKRVRAAIEEIGGTMPENIQPAEPIKSVEKQIKSSKPKLVLDTKDNLGVISSMEQIQ